MQSPRLTHRNTHLVVGKLVLVEGVVGGEVEEEDEEEEGEEGEVVVVVVGVVEEAE